MPASILVQPRLRIWTKQKFNTVESPVSDFEIDGKTFEVGGRNKGKKQISNQVPLWMFGFLY